LQHQVTARQGALNVVIAKLSLLSNEALYYKGVVKQNAAS
jgi:hypothetical protein